MKSDKYIFKKKFSLRRKSKRRLFAESAFMFVLSLLLFYINFLILNENFLLKNLSNNFYKSYLLIVDLFLYLYEIFLVFFIFITFIIALILLLGAFYRLFRVSKRKPKQIVYK